MSRRLGLSATALVGVMAACSSGGSHKVATANDSGAQPLYPPASSAPPLTDCHAAVRITLVYPDRGGPPVLDLSPDQVIWRSYGASPNYTEHKATLKSTDFSTVLAGVCSNRPASRPSHAASTGGAVSVVVYGPKGEVKNVDMSGVSHLMNDPVYASLVDVEHRYFPESK
jgi:hypothetical protein